MRLFAASALLFMLAACAQPVAQLPAYTEQERLAEMQKQKQLAQREVDVDYSEISFSKQERTAMKAHLQRIVDRMAPSAVQLCREMHGPDGDCNMHIELTDEKKKGLNAYADGKKIYITAAMIDFTRDDDEQLAFVLAHEYVHHMMGHVASAKQNVLLGTLVGLAGDIGAAAAGMDTRGQLTKLGASSGRLSYSPDFEQEADYIALYMLDRGGFDTSKAPHFWRRLAQHSPKGITIRTTHPTTPERFVLMQKTINEIERKKQAGVALRPNLLPKS